MTSLGSPFHPKRQPAKHRQAKAQRQTRHGEPALKLIRYAEDAPNDLELVFNAMVRIRKLPGGAVIARRWAALSQGFKP